jgi:uncharacterized protein YbjQ (UPF0145 family)
MEMDTPRTNPITSAEFANRKMAVFDIDDTILDVGQRFKDAVRGGFQNKDGSIPKGKVKQRQEFLYREDILMKDRVIPGAKALIDYLMERGYAIAYCTARPFAVYEATLDQLEAKGFPIFDSPNGEPLLYCKKALGLKKPVYKSRVVAELQAQYDVRLFFDNRIETCAAIAQIDVPGVYTSINDYWKLIQGDVRDNPYYTDPKTRETVFLRDHDKYRRSGEDPDAEPYGSASAHEDPSGMGSVGMNPRYLYTQQEGEDSPVPTTGKGFPVHLREGTQSRLQKALAKNPPLKPRRKKMKNGKYRKEPASSYIDRFMGNKKMRSEFPDDAQRYAVGVNYVDKIYGKSGLRSIGARTNPADAIDMKKVAEKPVKPLPMFSGKVTGTNKGVVFTSVQVGRNFFVDIGEGIQDLYRGLVGGRRSMTEKRMKMALTAMQQDLTKKAKKLGANAVCNLQIDYEFPTASGYADDLTLIAYGDAVKTTRKNPKEEYSSDYMVPRDVHKLHKAGEAINDTYYEGLEVPEWWKSKLSVTADQADNLSDALGYVADNPRSNPPKEKIEKGKKLYKHMNGVDPQKTETKTIDMGDVWYQVGEGGCWQIGYMSGKETGSSAQKYVHHFNEETKNGDFPKLYATIPDKGKPMLIITGGTWKIKTDDQGVAWIYD